MSLTRKRASGTAVAAVAILTLAACSSSETPVADESGSSETVTIATNNGELSVPVSPERVAVLDNTGAETALALGVTPIAVAKPLLSPEKFSAWIDDENIADVGTHREPDLEALNAAEPDLIIGGYRFSEYTDDFSDIATTIDIAPLDESEDGYIEGLRTQTTALGEIFGKQDEAAQIVADFDAALESAESAVDGESVFLAVAAGGTIDNGAGRIGRIIEPLDLNDVFASEDLDSDSVHEDSGLAPETVAQANPDWLILLDRDAAVSEGGEVTPAEQLVSEQSAWQDVTFVTEDQQIYLPADFYLGEGIQDYTGVYEQISSAFSQS